MDYQQIANRIYDLLSFDEGAHGELSLSEEEKNELQSLELILKVAGKSIKDFNWTT